MNRRTDMRASIKASPEAPTVTRGHSTIGARVTKRPEGKRSSRRESESSSHGSRKRALPRLRRIPPVAGVCAAVACLNAACWSMISPPFQAPDEPDHVAYVQQLAETGHLPVQEAGRFSPEELAALEDLRQRSVRFEPQDQTISSRAQQRQLQHDLAQRLSRTGPGGAGVASTQPPLYYALETVPYYLGASGTLLDRLELMRLLSVLMAGITACFVFLFVREALPKVPWAWAVGGLAVALAPLLGFASSSVNPDSMLYAVSAALFYCLARGFHRGLTTRLAIAIGLLTMIGFLTKLNFIGLAPGVLLGLIILALRERRTSQGGSWRLLAGATAISVSPVWVYVLVNLLSNHAGLGVASSAIHLANEYSSPFGWFSHIWQFYLPRLPGMANDFLSVSTMSQIWFERSVGLYGWLDTTFPAWVSELALIPAALMTGLCLRALIAGRAALRRRLVELTVYAVTGIGLLTLIGANSYLKFPAQAGAYLEPRYLLPLLPLLGAALALAARGAGRRWGPAAGASIVVLFLAHDVFSQLQVIARYYG
jgi:Predicted membrane protein (DUF2142)